MWSRSVYYQGEKISCSTESCDRTTCRNHPASYSRFKPAMDKPYCVQGAVDRDTNEPFIYRVEGFSLGFRRQQWTTLVASRSMDFGSVV